MAYTRTFDQLSTAVKTLGGWEFSIDVTPDVLLERLNDALIEGFDLMVGKWLDYYTLTGTLALVSGQVTYTLATISTNFYKLRHIDVSSDGTRFFRVYPYDIDTQHQYSSSVNGSINDIRYRLQGQNLVFSRMPSGGSANVYYIPQAPQFASIADVTPIQFDVPAEARLIVRLAHRDILERSDLPTDRADAAIARLIGNLKTAADARDSDEPFSLLDNPRRGYGTSGPDGDEWSW